MDVSSQENVFWSYKPEVGEEEETIVPPLLLPSLEIEPFVQVIPLRHHRRWVRALEIILGIFLFLSLSVTAFAWLEVKSLIGDLSAGAKHPIVTAAKSELNKPAKHKLNTQLGGVSKTEAARLSQVETILVVGSDARWGKPGSRSDTMMLVRIDPKNKTVSILSIPRDLRVPIPGYGFDKVNAAYAYGGEKLLIATLRDYFGVSINHFVETTFHGFGQMVSAIGGVYLPIDGRYYNHNVGTSSTNFANIDLQPGYQKLSSIQALQFVRFRHFDSDFYRAARQQLFLREVERQIVANKYDIGRMRSLLRAFTKNTASDISSINEIWKLTNTILSTPSSRFVRETLPAQDLMLNSIYYLQADTPTKRAVIERWYDPLGKIRTGNINAARIAKQSQVKAKKQTSKISFSLISDNNRGRNLIRKARYNSTKCAPTGLPPNYRWGSVSPVRTYKLNGQPALAGWITESSGNSVLLMETTWANPPILDSPTKELVYKGRDFLLWYDSGRIRQISWQIGSSTIWITNTLRNNLSSSEMLGLASSCRIVH